MTENYPIFHKTVKIFEKLASVTYNHDIKIEFRIGVSSRVHQINYDRFIVTLGTKAYKRLKRNRQKFLYRALTHELSHILFQSFKLNPIIKRIAHELDLRYDFVRNIANYFEDYRVDRLYEQLYPGAAKITHERNRWLRSKIATKIARKSQLNVFDVLAAILTNNDDLIVQSNDPYLIDLTKKTKLLFKEVEGKDYRATAIATLKFLKMLTTNKQTASNSNTINDLISEVKNSLDPDKTLSLYTQHEKHTNDSSFPQDDVETSCSQINTQELQDFINGEVNQILQESEKQMSKTLQTLKIQLNSQSSDENKLVVKGYEIDISTTIPSVMLSSFQLYDSMPSLVSKLTNLFRRIKNKSKLLNDQYGLMLSIEDVIQSKFNPNIREVFLQEQDMHTELSIKILLDLSESMKYGERISLAATACLTLYDALSKLPMVDFDVIGFASSGLVVYLPKLDRRSLARIIPNGCTPTHVAVKYAREGFSQKSSKRRLIIIVTDGEPYFVGYPEDFTLTKQEIDLARKSGIEVFTYFIAPNENRIKEQQMKIFGAPTTYEIVTDVSQLPQKLINFVSAKIVKSLLK